VPGDVLRNLNAGLDETVNLMEVIAVDHQSLMRVVFPGLPCEIASLRSPRLLDRMTTGGSLLLAAYGSRLWAISSSFRSDVVRGWAAMAVGKVPGIALCERLDLARSFAADSHFAVREWAWLGVRNHIVERPLEAVNALHSWVQDDSCNVRRFASEATRPIGVWSKHIPLLKEEPRHALPLLNGLRDDSSRYVRLSLGNWLNDASRSRPEWVSDVCRTWARDGRSIDVCHRGMRTIRHTA
jgi:3-methyladenine DNA glycosylase AlkC